MVQVLVFLYVPHLLLHVYETQDQYSVYQVLRYMAVQSSTWQYMAVRTGS